MSKSNSVINRYLDAGEEPTQTLLPIEGYEKYPLVSLEESIQRIKTLVCDLDSKVWVAKRNSSNPKDSLTIDESAAIQLYTMQWIDSTESLYVHLNQTLRSEKRDNLKPWFSYLKLFFTALYKLPSIKGTVWRGIRGDVSNQYQTDYIWWGFSSCTETMPVLEQFIGREGVRTIFMIECINGKSIQSHSYFKKENEILLLPGTYLRVIDKWSPAEGLHMIRLQEDDPPYQLITSPCHPSSNTATLLKDNFWLNIQYHDDKKTSIKTPADLESILTDPPRNLDGALLDRIQGSLIGLALGDTLGAPVNFQSHEYLVMHPVAALVRDERLGLKKGQFTDETSLALCLANSLLARRDFIPYDQLVRYKWWYRYGYMSCNGKSFDIGKATKESIEEFERRQKSFASHNKIPLEQIDTLSDIELLKHFDVHCSDTGVAGNGPLMRLAPVPLYFFRSPKIAVEYSGISGIITHGDTIAYDACRYLGALIVASLHGESKSGLLDTNFYNNHQVWFSDKPLHHEILRISMGSYKKSGGYNDGIRGTGYIVDSLEAALWAFWVDEDSFERGVLCAINLGGTTDTTASIYGQLAGAYYGYQKLPERWLKRLFAKNFIKNVCKWIAYEGELWKPK